MLGSDGFGYSIDMLPGGVPRIEKIPQVGTVVVGDDVEIGANTTIDRARFGVTRIGNCVKIDNLVQIGHNVQVGDCSGLIAQSGVAGSARIGNGCLIWAQAGISGHITVHDMAQVGPMAGVSKDIASGEYVLGAPAVPKREFAKSLMIPREVARLKEEVKALREELAKLQK